MTPGGGRVVHPPRPDPAPAITVNLHRAAGNWARNRAVAKARVDWEQWRERARAARADAVEHLPELLAELEAKVIEAGGVVHHAATADEARAAVVGICSERGLTRAVKAKSMITEELGLNDALADAGIAAVETDLGEYIVQLLDDRPSHILAPAVHLSAEQVAELFSQRSGLDFDADDTSRLVGYARQALRAEFLAGDVGITGVNFAVAETGTLVLVESEGNIRLVSSLPRVHIAVMGIEKVLRDWDAAAHLVQMLPLAAHGRLAATYTSFVTGPARDGDDGPQELHVVLVDDGRSALRGTELESVLHCIRCGACLYACPVYRQMGGHNYGSAYSGPIGAVLTPALEGSSPETAGLPWLSSLCGACTEACPVKIPLDAQLVSLRARARAHDPKRAETLFWRAWSRAWRTPAGYRATAAAGGKGLGRLFRQRRQTPLSKEGSTTAEGEAWISRAPFPFSGWTDERDARAPAVEPFHVRWRKRRGG